MKQTRPYPMKIILASHSPRRQELLAGSRPLMKFTNLLTHNLRAYTLFVTALLGCPWVYLLVEVVIMNLMYIYMHRTHETLCERLTAKLC